MKRILALVLAVTLLLSLLWRRLPLKVAGSASSLHRQLT